MSNGQSIDIFAIERRDEGLVELGRDAVVQFVALMLDVFDLF